MQKIVNVLAIASFAVSSAVVIGGVSVYANRGKIIDNVKSQVMDSVAGALGPAIGGALPDVTGPAQAPEAAPTPPSLPQ
jgi:hypothetical protein